MKNYMNFTVDYMKKKNNHPTNKQYAPNLCFYRERQVTSSFCQGIAHERR